MKSILVALTLATPALAETPLTVDEFEAIVTGQTYTYARSGQAPYGIEAYGPNRQVIWAFLDDRCEDGTYYAGPNDLICFAYPALNNESCWQFFQRGDAIVAISGSQISYDINPTTQTMPCIAPLLGV